MARHAVADDQDVFRVTITRVYPAHRKEVYDHVKDEAGNFVRDYPEGKERPLGHAGFWYSAPLKTTNHRIELIPERTTVETYGPYNTIGAARGMGTRRAAYAYGVVDVDGNDLKASVTVRVQKATTVWEDVNV